MQQDNRDPMAVLVNSIFGGLCNRPDCPSCSKPDEPEQVELVKDDRLG